MQMPCLGAGLTVLPVNNNKPFIVQLLPALESGGVERGTLEVAAELKRRGFRNLVISKGGRLVAGLEAMGVEHVQWDLGKKSLLTLFQIFSMRQWLLKRRPDILHVRSRLPAWIAWCAVRLMPRNNRPLLMSSLHGLHSVNIYSSIMLRTDHTICVSEAVKQYAVTQYRRELERLTLIPRGVDVTQFSLAYTVSPRWLADWKHQYPQLSDKLLICMPGRLSRRKGIDAFIRLIAFMRNDLPQIHGLILGEGPAAITEELHQCARDFNVESNLSFLGYRSDVKDIYKQCRIVYCLSSKPEAFGRTALEAVSLGVPVIAWDHGGVSEILGAMFPQGLVELNNSDQLLDVSLRIIENATHVNTKQVFPLSKMLDNTVKLYLKLYKN